VAPEATSESRHRGPNGAAALALPASHPNGSEVVGALRELPPPAPPPPPAPAPARACSEIAPFLLYTSGIADAPTKSHRMVFFELSTTITIRNFSPITPNSFLLQLLCSVLGARCYSSVSSSVSNVPKLMCRRPNSQCRTTTFDEGLTLPHLLAPPPVNSTSRDQRLDVLVVTTRTAATVRTSTNRRTA
jgi:hypothetical protein